MLRIIMFVFLLSLVSCGSLPRTDSKVVAFESNIKVERNNLEEVKVYESQFPEGVTKEGDLIKVSKGFENKIVILGKVEVDLVKGEASSPLLFTTNKASAYVKDKDLTSTHVYCKNMNWQNGVGFITFYLMNYLAPWNYPCYAVDSYAGDEPSDVLYREVAIKEKMTEEARKLGGNAIIGLDYAGSSLIAVNSGTILSTSKVWMGKAFVVKFLENKK